MNQTQLSLKSTDNMAIMREINALMVAGHVAIPLQPETLDFWRQPAHDFSLKTNGFGKFTQNQQVRLMKRYLNNPPLWRCKATTLIPHPPHDFSQSLDEIKRLHDPTEQTKRLTTLVAEIEKTGSFIDFLMAFKTYFYLLSFKYFSRSLDRLFHYHSDSWNTIRDYTSKVPDKINLSDTKVFTSITRASLIFSLSDRHLSLLLHEIDSSSLSDEEKLKNVATLARNPHLTKDQIHDLLRFVLRKDHISQGRWYVIALGIIGGNPECSQKLAHEIENHILLCQAPLASEDEAIFQLKRGREKSTNYMSKYVWPNPSQALREAPHDKTFKRCEAAAESFLSAYPGQDPHCPLDLIPLMIDGDFEKWRHSQIAPTTGDAYFARIIDNLETYPKIFGSQAGVLFYRHMIYAAPLGDTGTYLVISRGHHEAHTGLAIGIYATLPENPLSTEPHYSWEETRMADCQLNLDVDNTISAVNLQGYSEKRILQFNPWVTTGNEHKCSQLIIERYKALEAALQGAFITDLLMALSLHFASQIKASNARVIRDDAQIAYFDSPHGANGLYDRTAKNFGFSPPEDRDPYHRLDLGIDIESRIVEALNKNKRRDKPLAGEMHVAVYRDIMLPAYRLLTCRRGPYASNDFVLPEKPVIPFEIEN